MRASSVAFSALLAVLLPSCATATWVEVTRRPPPAADEGAVLLALPGPVTVSAGVIENWGWDWLRPEAWTDGAVAALRASGVALGARAGDAGSTGTHVTVDAYVDQDERWWPNLGSATVIAVTIYFAAPLCSFDSDATAMVTWRVESAGQPARTLHSEAALDSVRHLWSSPRETEMLTESKLIELTSADLAVQAGLPAVASP